MKQIIEQFIDDLDGSDADRSIVFGLHGARYRIDLSTANAETFEKMLQPYIEVSELLTQKVVQPRKGAKSAVVTHAQRRDKNQRIRQWAAVTGKQISAYGRIPQEIIDEYQRVAA